MSTYIQGVTDYIPQFQPFQPDLNFYANALQTKQTQYDTNYKALNNVYGQYFYADLTHGDNIKKKDELLKAIDFNLKRVSGLDLSLEQNVDQATQVFKPFYEDKHLMKDMAWTKNTNRQKAYAVGLKNSRDEKQRAQYWDAGIRAMDYKTEEFKNASLDETMNIGNINYTPYVNVMEKAQKIAKDAGLSVETVNMSPDGKWIVKNKNGEQLIPQLSHLFEATLGADPGVMDVYSTQAYVNRKDYAYSNAAQFGGDQNAAEMKYLSESYNMLKAENEARQAELQKNDAAYNKKAEKVEKAVSENRATPDTQSYLERLNEARNVNSTLLSSTEQHVNALSSDSGTATTSTGFENPYGDIESLRYKVDNAMAAKLMQKDLYEAANVFAYKDAKQDMEANPYAVQAQAHAYRMQEVASANASRERAARMRNATEMGKSLVETDGYRWDQDPNSPTYGQAIPKEEADIYSTEKTDEGSSTDKINLRDVSSQQSNRFIDKNVVPYLKNMLATMQDLKGELSPADMQTIFNDKNMTVEEFNRQLEANPYKFIKGTLGTTKLKKITEGFQKVIAQNYNVGNDAFTEAGKKMSNYTLALDDYYRHVKDLESWKKESRDVVINSLDKRLKPYAKFMFDSKGNQVSEEQFKANILNSKLISKDELKAYNGWVNYNKQKNKNRIEDDLTIWAGDSENADAYTYLLGKAKKAQRFINSMQSREKYNQYDPTVNADTARALEILNYKELKKAIHDGYTSAPIKKTPPGLSAIGDVKDSGLTSINRQFITVYPNAYNTVGAQNFNEIKKNIAGLDFETQIDVTYEGPTKSAKNKNASGKALIQQIFNETAKNNSSLKGFRIAAQPIAMNNSNKGAIIIYPDATFLAKHTYSKDKNGNITKAGIISSAEAQNILKYGISLVSDKKNWDNSLFESTYTTPLESSVNFNKEVKIHDPNDQLGMNYIKFSKDDVMGGYKYDIGMKQWDYDKNAYVQQIGGGRGITSGAELERLRQQAYSYWFQTQQINNENFQSNQ